MENIHNHHPNSLLITLSISSLLILSISLFPANAAATAPRTAASATQAHLLPARPDPKKISILCNPTSKPAYCKSLIPKLVKDGKTDPASVLIASIKATMQATKLARKEAQSKAPSSPPVCEEYYESTFDDLQKALDGLMKTKDYPSVHTELSAAVTMASTCVDDVVGSDPAVVLTADKLLNMTSICLDIFATCKLYPVQI